VFDLDDFIVGHSRHYFSHIGYETLLMERKYIAYVAEYHCPIHRVFIKGM
jgi:hypothetical protein